MGRVRTKTVKKRYTIPQVHPRSEWLVANEHFFHSAKVIIERYYPKLTLDFETNKRICDEIAIIPSKRLRNKVWHTGAQRPCPMDAQANWND